MPIGQGQQRPLVVGVLELAAGASGGPDQGSVHARAEAPQTPASKARATMQSREQEPINSIRRYVGDRLCES